MSNFMPPDSFISLLNQSRGILRKGQVIHHVHKTLIFIAELVPLSPLRLERIITERMPHIFTKEPVSADSYFLDKENPPLCSLLHVFQSY